MQLHGNRFTVKYKLKKSIEHLLKSDLTLPENERNPIFIASEKNLLALKLIWRYRRLNSYEFVRLLLFLDKSLFFPFCLPINY